MMVATRSLTKQEKLDGLLVYAADIAQRESDRLANEGRDQEAEGLQQAADSISQWFQKRDARLATATELLRELLDVATVLRAAYDEACIKAGASGGGDILRRADPALVRTSRFLEGDDDGE